MLDFTLNAYSRLLRVLSDAGFNFQSVNEFLEKPLERTVILRHDVDAYPDNSFRTAQIEYELGIRGTYYFRIVPRSNRQEIIRAIAGLGHEIGYHYEDLALAAKANQGRGTRDEGHGKINKKEERRNMVDEIFDRAIQSFEKNLSYFRQFGPVKTICMHGSPLSKYDNRRLWEKYNYKDYGIIGEPYFDIDFSKVLYVTDTGRRWDGEKVSVRDKVEKGTRDRGQGTREYPTHNFRSTNDIIAAASKGLLPEQIMITVHPQRWTNNLLLWTRELVWQNGKNVIKRLRVR